MVSRLDMTMDYKEITEMYEETFITIYIYYYALVERGCTIFC